MSNRTINIQTSLGTMQAELFEDRAPLTTANFLKLIQEDFYKGLIFHRVIEGFMIQGGCPEGTGRGGPGYKIQDEFHPELKHTEAGILSMANAGPNTGGSQFFITLAPTPWLDGKHAIFGRITNGLDVLKKIGSTATGPGDRPQSDVTLSIDVA
ncbi:MAG: peptidylprolyl isomerase [Spirochaetales bacterium]|nr:peptidylprolyl isomerase [Spirochaetales bacterium]